MHLKLLFLLMMFFSLNSMGQTLYKTTLIGKTYGVHMMTDGKGNLVIQNGGIFLVARDGKQIRKITPPANSFFIPGPNIVATYTLGASTEIYSLNDLLLKLATIPFEGNPLPLKNGNLAIFSTNGDVRIYTPKGMIVSQIQLSEGTWFASEFKDGHIAVSLKSGFAILSPDLKLIKQIPIVGNIITHQDAELFAYGSLTGGLSFYKSNGDIKFSLPEILEHSLLHLPNGSVAILNSDGVIEFYDSVGIKKISHNTEMTLWSPLTLVDDQTLAYWKSTEITFIDFEGKIKASYIWPSKRVAQETRPTLIGLGNGYVAAQYMDLSIHLIKFEAVGPIR